MSFIDASTFGGSDNVTFPRAYLSVGNAQLPVLSAKVTRKATRHADTFSADLSISATADLGFGLAEWADWDQTQDVGLLMSTASDGEDQQTMITGKIDMPSVNLHEMTVSISGRDKSASLTESKRNQKYQNQSSSDIASSIASDHGLNPNVVSTGSDFAGKIYDADTTNLVLNRTDFEALNQLAEREGYRWYVEGDDFYFEPKDQQSDVYNVNYTPPSPDGPAVANVLKLTFGKNCNAGRPHKVTCKSWNHRDKKLYTYTAEADGTGDPVEYTHHHNGKTQDQVTKLAQSRLKDRVRHELNITVEAPGDLTVSPRMQLQVSGTGTIYDQQFDIDSVDLEFDRDNGLVMTIAAKGARQGRNIDGQ